jgi:hypothetical protein
MSKPNTKINVSGKSIERNDLPQLLSDSDEDIAAFVDAFFDACVRRDLSESESMELLDTHLKMLSDEEVKSIADDVFGSIVPDSDDVTHKNNTNSKN